MELTVGHHYVGSTPCSLSPKYLCNVIIIVIVLWSILLLLLAQTLLIRLQLIIVIPHCLFVIRAGSRDFTLFEPSINLRDEIDWLEAQMLHRFVSGWLSSQVLKDIKVRDQTLDSVDRVLTHLYWKPK